MVLAKDSNRCNPPPSISIKLRKPVLNKIYVTNSLGKTKPTKKVLIITVAWVGRIL
jgi:hypothetical protein